MAKAQRRARRSSRKISPSAQLLYDALSTPEARAEHDRLVAEYRQKIAPIIEAVRASERITSDDLRITIGPCPIEV